MARPVFIIAARGISEDATTRLISIFSIVERLELTRQPLGAQDPNLVAAANRVVAQSVENVVFAVWMRGDGDEGVPFEHQFVIHGPRGDQTTDIDNFQFEANAWLHRFRLSMHGIPVGDQDFKMEIESRVRRTGTDEWTSQSYPIICAVIDLPA